MVVGNQKSQELSRVAECLYRTGNGTYVALIKVQGKQIKRSLKTSDRPLANRRLAELREKGRRLHGAENKNIRFEELAKAWLESKAADLKSASLKRREVAINGLSPYFSKKSVRSLGYSEIERWKVGRGSKVSAQTHNIELETLDLLFTYAINKGILLDNPADKFKRRILPHHVVNPPTRKEYVTMVQEMRASHKANSAGTTDMVEFLAASGLRVGEAREVRLCDVNFDQKRVRITGGQTGNKNHKERFIPLFPNLEPIIKRIIEKRKLKDPSDKLFKIDSPCRAMRNACKRANLPHFNPHLLRHFFATNAIEVGVNTKTLGEWLGHSDGGILAAKTYGHLRREFSEEMALKMNFQAEG